MTTSTTTSTRLRIVRQLLLPQPSQPLSETDQHAQQRVALCEDSGVVAVANGAVVELYLALPNDATTFEHDATGRGDLRDDSDSGESKRHAVSAAPPTCTQLQPLTHIALDEYRDIRGYAQKRSSIAPEESVMCATSVCFVAPCVLFVGASRSHDPTHAEASVSVWLFGFRIYVSNRMRSATVHLAFVEPIPAQSARGGVTRIERCRYCTSAHTGALVLLLGGSRSVGVFQWRDRLSDRQVSVADLPGGDSELVAAAMSADGRWCAIGDTTGRLHLLDCSAFEWFGSASATASASATTAIATAKRLRNSRSTQSGVAMRDSPLDAVRVASVREGPDAKSASSSLQWLDVASHGRKRHVLLAGSQSGSLSVLTLRETRDAVGHVRCALATEQMYPSVTGRTFDPIGGLAVPQVTHSDSNGVQVVAVSNAVAKLWTLPSSQGPSSIAWPSIREYLDAPAIDLTGRRVEGVAVVANANSLWSSTADDAHGLDDWAVVVMTDSALLVLAVVAAATASQSSMTLLPRDASVDNDINDSVDAASNNCSDVNDGATPRPGGDDDDGSNASPQRDPATATTIQERYRLPNTSWRARASSAAGRDDDDAASRLAKSTSPVRSSRLTLAAYDERVQAAAARVERLGGTLRMLRHSFQLFTTDVQQHMQTLSEQLEQAVERQRTQSSSSSSSVAATLALKER